MCSEEPSTGHKQIKDFSENSTHQTHHRDSYCESNTLQTHQGTFNSEKETQPQSSSENSTEDSHLASTYSESAPDPGDSYSENKAHCDDFYSESSALQGPTEESDQSSTGENNAEECKTLHCVSTPATHQNLLLTEAESNSGQEVQKEEERWSCEEAAGASECHTEGTRTCFSSSVHFPPPAFPPTDHQTHSFSSFITSSSSSPHWLSGSSFASLSLKLPSTSSPVFNSPVWLQEQLLHESVSVFQFFLLTSHISHDCIYHLKDHSAFFSLPCLCYPRADRKLCALCSCSRLH